MKNSHSEIWMAIKTAKTSPNEKNCETYAVDIFIKKNILIKKIVKARTVRFERYQQKLWKVIVR